MSHSYFNLGNYGQLDYNSTHDMMSSVTQLKGDCFGMQFPFDSQVNSEENLDYIDQIVDFQEYSYEGLNEESINQSSSLHFDDETSLLNAHQTTNSDNEEEKIQKIEGDPINQKTERKSYLLHQLSDQEFFYSDNGKVESAHSLKLTDGNDNPYDATANVTSKNRETHEPQALNIGTSNSSPASETKIETPPSTKIDQFNSHGPVLRKQIFNISNTSQEPIKYKKTLRQVLSLLKQWFILRGKEKTIVGKITERKMTALVASKEMGESKKSLDYYQLVIRKGIALGDKIIISDYLDKSFGALYSEIESIIHQLEEMGKLELKYQIKSRKVKVGVFEFVMNS